MKIFTAYLCAYVYITVLVVISTSEPLKLGLWSFIPLKYILDDLFR